MNPKEVVEYLFRDDDGVEHSVPFEEAMTAVGGFLERPGGELWRRVGIDEVRRGPKDAEAMKYESESMGFPDHQLDEMREHLERSDCPGIEFQKETGADENDTGFYKVVGSSRAALDRYMKKRGFANHGNTMPAVMCPKTLRDTKELLERSCKASK